ncbi:uncharacterized protein LOC142586908 [Dermacentor variabilis]|uniref:uncharacterized protein LOC142586908 n=1 Tax=Dermacentor variabilis TaxID=34621 RepID=UPI003F5B6918
MYFQQYSSAPPAALPANAAGNFPGQPFPIAAPGGPPYVQQPQLVESRPELAQPAAPDAVYPEPVQHIDSPYPLAAQRVLSTYPQPPPQPTLGTVGIDPGQGSYAPVALGAPVPQLAPAYTGAVDLQAEPWGAGLAAESMTPYVEPPPAPARRRRMASPLGRTPSDWVFCLTVTLVLLLAVLVALAYFSYQKLLAMRRRRPRHGLLLEAATKFWQPF